MLMRRFYVNLSWIFARAKCGALFFCCCFYCEQAAGCKKRKGGERLKKRAAPFVAIIAMISCSARIFACEGGKRALVYELRL